MLSPWVDSGIRDTHVGEALGHGCEGTSDCRRSDRDVTGETGEGLPAAIVAVAGAIGEKDLEPCPKRDIREGAGDLGGEAEL